MEKLGATLPAHAGKKTSPSAAPENTNLQKPHRCRDSRGHPDGDDRPGPLRANRGPRFGHHLCRRGPASICSRSLSAYARQFLGKTDCRGPMSTTSGLSPALAISSKKDHIQEPPGRRRPRQTRFVRLSGLLFARVGVPISPPPLFAAPSKAKISQPDGGPHSKRARKGTRALIAKAVIVRAHPPSVMSDGRQGRIPPQEFGRASRTKGLPDAPRWRQIFELPAGAPRWNEAKSTNSRTRGYDPHAGQRDIGNRPARFPSEDGAGGAWPNGLLDREYCRRAKEKIAQGKEGKPPPGF